jgi:hypothetical protein
MKKYTYIFASLLAVIAIFICFRQKNDFSPLSIESAITSNKAFIASNDPIASEILTQPYYSTGKGYLSYAFTSKDGQFLLRFLREKRLSTPSFWQKKEKAEQRNSRSEQLFTSYKIAHDLLAKETGMLFLQLTKPEMNLPQVALFDNSHKHSQLIDLNKVAFLIQLKASDAKTTIESLMDQNKVEEAKKRLDQIFSLVQSTTEKGVLHTSGLTTNRLNIGFIKNEAIYIDCAKLQIDPKINLKTLFIQNLRTLKTLNRWLMLHYPELSIYYQSLCKKTASSFDKDI